NIADSAMLVRMIVVMVMMAVVTMIRPVIAAAHVMVMRLLGQSHLGFVADNLRAVFAQLTVHVGVAAVDFGGAFQERVDDQGMIAQIGRLDELDRRKARRRIVGLAVD